MATLPASRAGPIRTAKTPKRVRFAGENRDQTRIIRQQEAHKRDARSIPRVDVDVTTSYEIPALSIAAEALFGYAKSTLNSAKSTLENVVEFSKFALTSSFTSSFGKISLSFNGDQEQPAPAQQQQASMLEYPPFLAGATPNVVKKNRRDYYQSLGVINSMKKAKSYAPGSTPARTPDHMQSDKEKNWYRFHETPYVGHKLDFGRGRSATALPPLSKPEYRFDSPTRLGTKRKAPKSSAKKQQRSAMKKRSKAKLGDIVPRRSNVEEFHANFSGRERNELYASYTRFLTAIRFDVKQFAKDLRDMRLPTDTTLKIHERMKRSDWDFFMRIMADEEYWAQVKGVGSTKVPVLPDYAEPQPKRANVFPCEYCQSHEWAGKVEVREIENEGDEVPMKGHTKFDEPYTQEELLHIEAGRYYKVFHRFCHESRYDWKFPDPSRPCSWEGQNIPRGDTQQGEWSISKYDPRLRHFPLYMQKVPKRVRQIQQELQDVVTLLTDQDRAAWLYIQGIRRHNTRMATLLEKMDLERKRRQVHWPCQMQVKVHIKNMQEPEPKVIENTDVEELSTRNKRAHSPEIEEIPEPNGAPAKRARFLIDKQEAPKDVHVNGNYKKASVEEDVEEIHKKQAEQNPEEYSRKRTRSDDEMEDTHKDKRAHTRKPRLRTPPSSFGLFSEDEETEDDEETERVREWERQRASKDNEKVAESQQEQPKLTWLQKLDAAMKQREAELAAQKAENAKIEAEKVAAKPPTPKQTDKVPPVHSNKPVFSPALNSTVPAPAPKKPFVFEDPSPTQEQTIPTDDGKNPLQEHTNGVKPSSPALAVPNLFSSAVPNLAPPGLNFGQTNVASPLKPVGAPNSTVFGPKTGTVGLFGNEENIPTTNATAQAPAPAAPATTTSASSIFAPKELTSVPSSVFKFAAPAAPSVPSTGGFSAPVQAPVAAPTTTPNESTFSHLSPKKDDAKKFVEPAAAASSIFSGLSTASAPRIPAVSIFATKSLETAPESGNLFPKATGNAPASNIFARPAEPSLFGKSAQPTATNIFSKATEPTMTNPYIKPADTATTKPDKPTEGPATVTLPKPAGTVSSTNIFSNLGGVSTAPMTNTVPTTVPTLGIFGTSTPAPSSATTTSGLFSSIPSTAPVEAPKPFVFGGDKAMGPKDDFGAKPETSTFNFGSTAKTASNAFNFGAGSAKPAESAAVSQFTNTATTSAPPSAIFTSGVTTSAPSSSVFISGATTTALPAMTTSFPTSNRPFVFQSSSAAPVTTISQSFPPTTPQCPPPLFGGFKPQDTPTKQSPGNKFISEDISMASPEQSPEKPSPKGLFGATTNSMVNGNAFSQNKPFFSAPAAPSPLGKLNFQTAAQSAAPSNISFGAPVSQPAVTMQTSTAPIATAPASFNFGSTSFLSMPPSIPGTSAPAPATVPASGVTPFQWDATGIDLNAPAVRRTFATPRGRRGVKRG